MTDSQVLAMGNGRRAPRAMKLEKPAPLKRSVSLSIIDVKVNTFQGVRASRRTNLTKPIPRSKATSDEGTVHDTVIHEDIQRAGMTPNTAKRTAEKLIASTLADLKDTETSNTAAVKSRLKPQMIDDSGAGYCNNNRISRERSTTDSQVLAMGVGRRAPRSTKLEKPAPLKRIVYITPITYVKDNAFRGVRAQRRINLKTPIRKSKYTSDECTIQDIVVHVEIQRDGRTPNTAKRHQL